MYATSELIYLWRLKRGLTQAELARKTGVPQPNLSHIEQGGGDVTLRTLRKLAGGLDLQISELIEGPGPGYRGPRRPLTRRDYIQIAEAAFSGKQPRQSFHRYMGERFRRIVPGLAPRRTPKKQLDLVWSNLKTALSREEFNQILEKIRERRLQNHGN
ncbi:MAG: hypothetical protein COV76_03975 [Candidatus Omnitrophica bacterium CG11_big_fil_rev_8_21_14_0_20_64_10]|nr:MAG: hypothetical protein COV76_03975 [Candidatus Omnitrophica bacterium CG11_big_fil_rev_8_21_14_0_20_64_10]